MDFPIIGLNQIGKQVNEDIISQALLNVDEKRESLYVFSLNKGTLDSSHDDIYWAIRKCELNNATNNDSEGIRFYCQISYDEDDFIIYEDGFVEIYYSFRMVAKIECTIEEFVEHLHVIEILGD